MTAPGSGINIFSSTHSRSAVTISRGGSSQTNASSGTLAVTNGGSTVDITLLGQYVTGNFHVSSGTGGGTVVSDPPVLAQTDPQPGTLVNPHQA